MSESLQKFQNLLHQLFEFECADLEFDTYRIMNHKRQVIERFIIEDLPKAISEELHSGALAEQEQAYKALEEARQKVLELFKDDYLLRYMLQWEARKSETLLDVEKPQTPLSYKLHLYGENGRTAAVIWQETKDWTKEDYERDRGFVVDHRLAEGADIVFVNSDSFIPG